MTDEQLLKHCLLPRWRILVEEKRVDGGFGHRLYWEWCDKGGNSSGGREVEDGNWQLFADMFNGVGSHPTMRLGKFPDSEAFDELRKLVESEEKKDGKDG